MPSPGEVVKRLRLARGLSQEEVAKRGGLSNRTLIANIERGQNQFTGSDAREKVAKGLGMTYAELVRELGEAAKPLRAPEKTVKTVERRVERDDVYPTRPAFLELMRLEGYEEGFIKVVANYHERSNVDPGSPDGRGWMTVVRELQAQRRELRQAKEEPVPSEAPDVSDKALEEAAKKKPKRK